jgi:LysM repeat protein
LTVFDHETGTLQASNLLLTPENNKRPVASASASTSKAGRKVWKVRSGDTLYGISKRTGVSVSSLRKLNGMGSRSALSVGQRVRYK